MKVVQAPSFRLDQKTVLVKFFFTNPAHIPAGILEKNRAGDEQMDMKHCLSAVDKELTTVGRVREGQVDTGEAIVQNKPMTQPAMLRKGLASNDYSLTNAHWYRKIQDGKTPKYVVVLVFKHNVEANLELARKTVDAIRKLANALWFCHIWRNKDTFTINFVGLQQGNKPSYSVTTRRGSISVEAAFTLAGEEEE